MTFGRKRRSGASEARRLCDNSGNTASDSLAPRLHAIAAGLRLRRQLDMLGPDGPAESSRREVVRRLAELQQFADLEMEALAPGTRRYCDVADHAKEGLTDLRAALRDVLTSVRLGPLHQAMAIEGLRTDVEWQSALVARLDRETPHPVTVWLDVELGRLRSWLGAPAGRDPDPRDEPLRTGCERLQAVVLERRINRELARPLARLSAERLWAERLQLTRLQAQVEALDLASERDSPNLRLVERRVRWLDALHQRRGELADLADDRLTVLDLGCPRSTVPAHRADGPRRGR